MKLAVNIIVVVLFLNSRGFSQLKKGDHVPDLVMRNVMNHTSSEIRLSDFKGKLIIIDFWGPGCSSCYRAFPKIDSLQQVFGDKIQFILVNAQSMDSTMRFFKRYKSIKKPRVPMVTGDTSLKKIFPHIGMPFHVWIDSDRTVAYFTSGYNATPENISAFLSGKRPNLLNNQKSESFNPIRSLFPFDSTSGSRRMGYYSLILPYNYVRTISTEKPPKETHLRKFIMESSIAGLFKIAFEENGKYNFRSPNLIILEVANPENYVLPIVTKKWDEFESKYAYTYDLVVPIRKSRDIYEIMKQDLNRFFDLDARVEKRKVECMVLIRTGHKDLLRSRGGKPVDKLFLSTEVNPTPDSLRMIRNMPFSILSSHIRGTIENSWRLPTPFVDSSHYVHNIDFYIKPEVIDSLTLESLKSELRKYGLDLVLQEITRDVLVIKERK